MKNLSLALNAILLLAVGYLYILHFSGKTTETPVKKEMTNPLAGTFIPDIVYVNADTLLQNYDYFKKEQEKLAKQERDAEASMKSRAKKLENEFMAVQKKVQSGQMTPKQIAEAEQDLGMKQQKLMQEQESLSGSIMRASQEVQLEMESKIKAFLTEIQAENGYDYIFSYGPGTGVLMVNDSLDITQNLLVRLNAKVDETAETDAQ